MVRNGPSWKTCPPLQTLSHDHFVYVAVSKTKSMEISIHGSFGTGRGMYKPAFCRPAFAVWQTLQVATNLLTSLLILGQNNFLFTSSKVLSLPKCRANPFECISLTSFSRRDPNGMHNWEPLNKNPSNKQNSLIECELA